jgi:hypothetical protein
MNRKMHSRRRRRGGASEALLTVLLFGVMCGSHGRSRSRDVQGELTEDDGPAFELHSAKGPPRQVREEALENRRGPAWLAKLPQKLLKGDRGNRPFAVQDARISRGLREAPVSKAKLRDHIPSTDGRNSVALAVQRAAPVGKAMSSMRPRPEALLLQQDAQLLEYDQEQLWRQRAREAWNSMLENARVGILSRGKLIVEPRLRGCASSVMAAALSGDVEQLKGALDEDGACVGATNSVGETPLMLAAISGNPDAMALLLARGAELDTCDMHGWTALMKAVAIGDDAAVRFLLASGADAEVRNAANQTACLIAGAWGRRPAERLLIAAAACPPQQQQPLLPTPQQSHSGSRASGRGSSSSSSSSSSSGEDRVKLGKVPQTNANRPQAARTAEASAAQEEHTKTNKATACEESASDGDWGGGGSRPAGGGWRKEADARLEREREREREARPTALSY